MQSQKKIFGSLLFLLLIIISCSKKSYISSRGAANAEKVAEVEIILDSLEKKMDKSLTGIFAGLHYMEKNRGPLYGLDVQSMVLEFNAGLSGNRDLMRLFSVIEEMYVDDNKVYMRLAEEKFSLDKMRIYENAVISYDFSEPGNKRTLTIEEGVDVGLGFIRYDLNKVEMDLTNGDLEFFYGSRNKTASLNMKKDILKMD